MKDNREQSIAITLQYEGGYTNDPHDPGGPTNWGITIKDAQMYWKSGATAADVKAMPKDVAIEIYRKKYWDRMQCDSYPYGVDLCTFDYGVHSGTARALNVNHNTMTNNAVQWVKDICSERLSFLKRLKIWAFYQKGFTRRVTDVEARGVKMATNHLPSEAQTQVLKAEAKKAGTKSKAAATKAGGTVAAPASTQVPDVPHHIDITAWHGLPKVGLWLAAAGCVALTAYFVYWAWVHRSRAQSYEAVANA